MPFIVSVVGFSQSGKTTLIQEMIPLLRAKGYQVGVIKHTDKKIAEAPAGKDTFQFNQAGAQAVGLWGADGFTLTKSPSKAAAPTLEQAAFYLCPEVDILLTEGFKKAATPKILVLTPGQEDRLVTEVRGVILATVGPNSGLAGREADTDEGLCPGYHHPGDHGDAGNLERVHPGPAGRHHPVSPGNFNRKKAQEK